MGCSSELHHLSEHQVSLKIRTAVQENPRRQIRAICGGREGRAVIGGSALPPSLGGET